MVDIVDSTKHWLVVLYGRVSTSLQEDQKTIQNQLMEMKDFCDRKFGRGNYTIIHEYLDEAWSGDSLVRPGLDQLRMDASKKIWDAVVIYDSDRLARRSAWQEVVTEELKEKGINVLYVTVPEAKNDEDIIMGKMRGVFAEYERMKMKERFRIGKLRKVKDKHILTSEALYGYKYIPNNKDTKEHGYYVINEEEAEVVRMIFKWVGEEAMSLRQVVRELQKLGKKPRRSKRGVWNTSTLSTMLRHRGYIGQAHWGSSYAVVPEHPIKKNTYRKVKKSSRKTKPVGEWIADNIPIPAIIEEDLFEKVRAQLKVNFDLCSRNTKNEYLLGGGIILCECGRNRYGEGPQRGKFLYYRCTDRLYSFPLPPTCKRKGINARIADRLVWQELTKLMASPELMMAQIDRWITDRRSNVQSAVGNIEEIEKEIAKEKVKEKRYSEAYGAGVFSLEQLQEYAVPARSRISALEAKIKEINQAKNQMHMERIPTEAEVQEFAAESVKTLNGLNFEEKRAIIINTIQRIIGTQKQLQVSGAIPLTLSNVLYKTIGWRAKGHEMTILPQAKRSGKIVIGEVRRLSNC